MSAIRGNYLALEHMSRQNGGRGGVIVNIASMAGEFNLLILSPRTFFHGGTEKSDIILGRLTFYFCRYRSSAIMSCLYSHQARTGWLHSSHGGERVVLHGSLWCY